MNRRSFLRGLLVVSAATVTAPTIAKIASLSPPMIFGDGIHDDTAGIQAALDGKPFLCDGLIVSDANGVYFKDGVFRVTRPLVLRRSNIGIHDATLVADHPGTMIEVRGRVEGVLVKNMTFDRRVKATADSVGILFTPEAVA
jgi:hypothetical protein